MKSRITIDLELLTREYADSKEVQKELNATSRNDLMDKALKQYDPHRKEVSPQFEKWLNDKCLAENSSKKAMK